MSSFIPDEAGACPVRRPTANLTMAMLGHVACAANLWACAGEISTTAEDERRSTPSALARAVAGASEEGDVLRGGRLFDKFYEESPGIDFVPDEPETAALDGRGGPAGDG